MIQLTRFEYDVLTESAYLSDDSHRGIPCWRCDEECFPGQLIHFGPQGAAHARCLVPRPDVHLLHAMMHLGGR